jgi:hypothetical protein
MDMSNTMLISYNISYDFRVKFCIFLVILLIEFLIKIWIKCHMNFRSIKNYYLKYFKVRECLYKMNILITKEEEMGPLYLLDILWMLLLFLVLNSKVLEIRNNKIIESCNVIFLKIFI